MMSRLTASWLIVLVLAPFTAPFPTCDLATFFGGAQTRHVPANTPASATLAGDSTIANVPAISRVARVRLLQAAHAASSSVECFSATATSTRGSTPSFGLRDTASLRTILRV